MGMTNRIWSRAGCAMLVLVAGGCAADVGQESFDVDGVSEALTGRFRLIAGHSGKCLDVAGAGTANGVHVQQWPCNGNNAQAFNITDLGNGFHRITNVNSGKDLDIRDVSYADGAALQQWDYGGGLNQQWSLQRNGDGSYRIVARHSGKSLDVSGGSTADRAPVIQWPGHGGDNQKWWLEVLGGGGGGSCEPFRCWSENGVTRVCDANGNPRNCGSYVCAPGGRWDPAESACNGGGGGGGGGSCTGLSGNRTLRFRNQCNQPIWMASLSTENPVPHGGGWFVGAGQTSVVTVPERWNGRFWGRTGCNFDAAGNGSCETGDCGGRLRCGEIGGRPPASLAEFTLSPYSEADWYNVSLVDGYNLPIQIIPTGNFCPTGNVGDCELNRPGCVGDLNTACPGPLRVTNAAGRTVGCKSNCLHFGTDWACCAGAYGLPGACNPQTAWPANARSYLATYHDYCPNAYAYAYDEDPAHDALESPLFTCRGKDYDIIFCP